MVRISARQDQSIVIADSIVVTVRFIRGEQVHLEVACPSGTAVHRQEFPVLNSLTELLTGSSPSTSTPEPEPAAP
jgi:sRNA-binding carbon storage regulator CsrA